jgi:hypothetical protein
MGKAMRFTSLGAFAFLAILMLAPAPARAFQFDSMGGGSPDGAAAYADPDELLTPKLDQKGVNAAPNGATLLQGLQLNVSGGSTSSSVTGGAMGWTNPQPGRLTH